MSEKFLKNLIQEITKQVIQEQRRAQSTGSSDSNSDSEQGRRTISDTSITLNLSNVSGIAREIQNSWTTRGRAYILSTDNIRRIARQFRITPDDVGDVVHALGANTQGTFGTPEGMRRAIQMLPQAPPPAPPPLQLSSLRGRRFLLESMAYASPGSINLLELAQRPGQDQIGDLVYMMRQAVAAAQRTMTEYPVTVPIVSLMIPEYQRIADWAATDPFWGRIAGTINGPLPSDWDQRASFPSPRFRNLTQLWSRANSVTERGAGQAILNSPLRTFSTG